MGRSPYQAGTERFVNGYVVVKQASGEWKYKHHILAEEKLGRLLESNERVCFKDGDRTNLDLSNIEIRWKLPAKRYQRQSHLRREIIRVQSTLRQLEEQLEPEDEDGPVAEEQEGRGGRSYQPTEADTKEV